MGLITDQTGELNIIALAKLWLNCPKKYAIVFVTSHYHSRFYTFYAFSLTSASLESTLIISCSLHKVSPPICVSIWRGSRGLPPPAPLNCRLRDKIDHLYYHKHSAWACLVAIIVGIVIISIILIIIIINILMIIAALQCTTICGLRSAVSALAACQSA